MTAELGVAVDRDGGARSAGQLQQGAEHRLHHRLGLLLQVLGLETLQDVQQGLETSLADQWMTGLRLLDHVKHRPESQTNNLGQRGLPRVRVRVLIVRL